MALVVPTSEGPHLSLTMTCLSLPFSLELVQGSSGSCYLIRLYARIYESYSYMLSACGFRAMSISVPN